MGWRGSGGPGPLAWLVGFGEAWGPVTPALLSWASPAHPHSIELRTGVLLLDSLDLLAAVAGLGAEDRSGESAGVTGQAAAVAPDLANRQFRFLGFDDRAWVQLLGGLGALDLG